MRSRLFSLAVPVVVILVLSHTFVSSQSSKKLTNGDVVDMTKAGISEGVIIEAVQQSQAAFELGASDLIQLKRSGVSDRVLAAMQAAVQRVTHPPGTSSSEKGPLARAAATELLNRTKELSEPFSTEVELRRTCVERLSNQEYFARVQAELTDPAWAQSNVMATEAVHQLAALHLIEMKNAEPKPGECKGTNPQVHVTSLTPSGEKEAVNWTKIGTNAWSVPMSRRQVTVTGIQAGDEQALIEFTWRWMPIYGSPTATGFYVAMPGRAGASLFDDGWRLDTGGLSQFHATFYDSFNTMNGKVDLGTANESGSRAAETPTNVPSTIEGLRAAFDSGRFGDVITGSEKIFSGNPNDPDASQLLAQAYAATGRYADAIRPARLALAAKRSVGLRVQHEHSSFVSVTGSCVGKLDLAADQLSFASFTTALGAAHGFSVPGDHVLQVHRVTGGFEGRVDIRVQTTDSGKSQTRSFAFYVPTAKLSDIPAVGLQFKCPGCGIQGDELAELIRLISPTAKR